MKRTLKREFNEYVKPFGGKRTSPDERVGEDSVSRRADPGRLYSPLVTRPASSVYAGGRRFCVRHGGRPGSVRSAGPIFLAAVERRDSLGSGRRGFRVELGCEGSPGGERSDRPNPGLAGRSPGGSGTHVVGIRSPVWGAPSRGPVFSAPMAADGFPIVSTVG